MMESVKQGGIKYHYLSLCYDSTRDWTPVSQAIGEHSTHNLFFKNKKWGVYLFMNNII